MFWTFEIVLLKFLLLDAYYFSWYDVDGETIVLKLIYHLLSNLNPSDSTSICLINTNQNEHIVLHVMSHDSFQLSMLLPSLWHLIISSYLNQHGVSEKLLAWQVELSFCNNSFDILQPKQKPLSSNRVWKNPRLQTALFVNSSVSWI